MNKYVGSCDLIINTISIDHEASLYIGLLRTSGNIV